MQTELIAPAVNPSIDEDRLNDALMYVRVAELAVLGIASGLECVDEEQVRDVWRVLFDARREIEAAIKQA